MIVTPEIAFPPVEGDRGAVLSLLRDGYALTVGTVQDVNDTVLGEQRLILVLETGAFYEHDALSGEPDNGTTILHDNEGRVYLRKNYGGFPAYKVDIRTVVLTAGSGTYEPAADVFAIEVLGVGGGGGGAGAQTTSAANSCGAGGGAGGAGFRRRIGETELEASYTYTVGAKGLGGPAPSGNAAPYSDGQDGGDTSFVGQTINMSAMGGLGAKQDAESAGLTEFIPGYGQYASGGEINIKGQNGGGGLTAGNYNGAPYQVGSGDGGNAPFGQGFGGRYRNGGGTDGVGYGSGGSGAGMIPAYGALDRAGGDGADGIIIITEFVRVLIQT